MNKASKHIQNGYNNGQMNSNILGPSSSPLPPIKSSVLQQSSPLLGTHHQPNVISSIMNFLPDNRPITSLQIVEDHEKCPKNFSAISRTYDQDADADLWRETTILFGRQTTRYLCLSKTEGLPEYVVETLKVIAEKIPPPKEFSLLSRTADSDQKAWRKRQISYKLSKRGTVTHAVTDIILCSKLKIAPDGFKLAGDINGVLVCYKTSAIPVRLPPPVPGLPPTSQTITSPQATTNSNGLANGSGCSEVENALNRLNLSGKSSHNNGPPKQALPAVPNDPEHDYEEISSSYQITSPTRPAPPLPAGKSTTISNYIGTLGSYTELEGVPFIINPVLKRAADFEVTGLPTFSEFLKECDYDFNLERQVLCTMKASSSKNPFFN